MPRLSASLLALAVALPAGGCVYLTGRFACADDSHCPSWMTCGDTGVCQDGASPPGVGDDAGGPAPLDCKSPEVHAGTVSLRTAADIQALVPAGAACLRIEGSLLVEGSELVDLAGLERLGAITGSLVISDNARLEHLDGLSGLVSVGAELEIRGNGVLADVSGLSSLEEVGGDVEIRDNPALGDDAARALVGAIGRIGGDSRVRDNGG